MDDQKKENDDLVIDDNGSINQDSEAPEATKDSKIEESTLSEPEVNGLQAPPEEPIIETQDSDSDEVSDADDNNSTKVDNPIDNDDSTDETVVAPPDEPNVISSGNEATQEQVVTSKDPFAEFATEVPAETAATPSGLSNNEQLKPHKEHKNNKKLAVIVTLLIALILSLGVVYIFISAEDNTAELRNDEQTSELPVQEIEPATTDNVDQSLSEIDQTLDSIDDTDLQEDTISDQTLGL